MATSTFSGRNYSFNLNVSETSTNADTNTSVVSYSLTVAEGTNTDSYRAFNDGTWSLVIDGATVASSTTWNYDFRGSVTSITLASGTRTITHDSTGAKTLTFSASADGKTPLGTASVSGSTVLTNFNAPAKPVAPTLTRNSAGTTVTVVSAIPSSDATITNYDLRWSYDAATWTTVTGIGTDRTGTVTVTATSTVYVQTRAVSAQGNGTWSNSTSIVGIPTAPATIATTRNGRNVDVTAGSSTGSGITDYKVQYSTNAGSTWSTAVTMTSQAYTYSNLTPALTYLFRVYSTNSIGNSGYTTSSGVFVPAGGKRWDGSAWVASTIGRRWDGTAWVDLTTAKRWDGSAWTDLS